jgi:hypothetical protein
MSTIAPRRLLLPSFVARPTGQHLSFRAPKVAVPPRSPERHRSVTSRTDIRTQRAQRSASGTRHAVLRLISRPYTQSSRSW